ncbi:hypothetical protein AB0L82_38685 [Nocardia sp. NPDC052001]|uniref:hypothetical protein n=1 Tax=Nocardia sp. NPDC052001 TaxID=3154853 RepID=UPI003417DF67
MDLTLVVYDYDDDRDPGRLLSLLRVEGADAVLAPGAEHLSDNDIAVLFPLAEVFCIEETRLYTIHCADSTEPEGTLRITDIAERIAEVESWV